MRQIIDSIDEDENAMISPPSTPSFSTNISNNINIRKRGRHNKTSEELHIYAEESRMPLDEYSNKEQQYIINQNIDIKEWIWIEIRNNILKVWHSTPHRQVQIENISFLFPIFGKLYVLVVYKFLIDYSVINFGILNTIPLQLPLIKINKKKPKIIIIGAGISGLTCARQLCNLYNQYNSKAQITILEGTSRVGGRINSHSMQNNAKVELGAMVIMGFEGGNPLKQVIQHQLRLKAIQLTGQCELYDIDGFKIDKQVDLQVETQFNQMLDVLAKSAPDTNLQKALNSLEPLALNEQSKRILNWHYANMEFANAASLDKLSAKWWGFDDEEEFEGNHSIVIGGYSQLTEEMENTRFPNSKNFVDVKYNHKVNQVNYLNEKIIVKAVHNDEEISFDADYVVLAVPLGVLKKDYITFIPQLPLQKYNAIKNLGFGLLNKIIVRFSNAFWDRKMESFGCLRPLNGDPVDLRAALIAGESSEYNELLTDKDVLERFLNLLKSLYPRSNIEVLEYKVTKWGSDLFTHGAYSFVPDGQSPILYDQLAKPIKLVDGGKLFFCGEHTNRLHAATVHGAMISGLDCASELFLCSFN